MRWCHVDLLSPSRWFNGYPKHHVCIVKVCLVGGWSSKGLMTWDRKENKISLDRGRIIVGGWPTFRPSTKLRITLLQCIALKYVLVRGMVDQSICTPKMTLAYTIGHNHMSICTQPKSLCSPHLIYTPKPPCTSLQNPCGSSLYYPYFCLDIN